eukprot:Gb_33606 [translate_table: standard]
MSISARVTTTRVSAPSSVPSLSIDKRKTFAKYFSGKQIHLITVRSASLKSSGVSFFKALLI